MKSTIIALGLIVAGSQPALASDLTFQQAFDQTYPAAPKQGGPKEPVYDLNEAVGREIERQNAQARTQADDWQLACVPANDPMATPAHLRGVGFQQVWLKFGDAPGWGGGSITRQSNQTVLDFPAGGVMLRVTMSTQEQRVELNGTERDGSWGTPILMSCGVYQPGPRPQ